MLTVNAMTTADTVLVPIQCEYYALEGISQLIHTIDLVQERLNPDLKMEGVVFTMYDSRTNLSNEVVDNVKNNLHTTIYKINHSKKCKISRSTKSRPFQLIYTTAGQREQKATDFLQRSNRQGGYLNGNKKRWIGKRFGFIDCR